VFAKVVVGGEVRPGDRLEIASDENQGGGADCQ
jgi:hypothetical protein